MSSFPALEVALGLAMTYLLLALVSTSITEWFARLVNSRGKTLVQGIAQLVGENADGKGPITQALLKHPLIKPLGQKNGRGGQRCPSYIPADLFAKALLDISNRSAQSISEENKNDNPKEHLEKVFQALRPAAASLEAGTVPANLKVVEDWYNDHMDRVSGWYKRHTQTVVLVTAIVLTLVTNANTVRFAKRLWTDAPLRSAAVEAAKARLQQGPPLQAVEYENPTTPKPLKPLAAETDNTNRLFPEEQQLVQGMLGWEGELASFEEAPAWWIATHAVGWFISVLAISLGAPFWFDTLQRLMNIRSAGQPPKKP